VIATDDQGSLYKHDNDAPSSKMWYYVR